MSLFHRRSIHSILAVPLSVLMMAPPLPAANHREAPITALDHKADITDVYAFRSYEPGRTNNIVLIMGVDPLLEPGNGPNYFPFDDEILYELKVDNNHDAVEDVVFQFRFRTELRLPGVFTSFVGAGAGIVSPTNSPAPVPPGTPIVPPQINSFSSPGLGLRQSYSVTMVKNGIPIVLTAGGPTFALPANAGPRTMDHAALRSASVYTMTNGVRTFAGNTDDGFWIDLGGAFDTLNTHKFPVLSPAEDASLTNYAADFVSGYSVNSIAVEVPISMLTRTGAIEPATSPAATIGVWASTSRPRVTVRRAPLSQQSSGNWQQVQRMGNPLINELIIGTGFKDRFSMDQPKNDGQFASFFLDPLLARVINAAFGGAVAIPPAPRTDLLPLVVYTPPIAATGTPTGPVADMLRLNTGVAPTPEASINRLGLLGGDGAGFPNGRRLQDDVTDIALRAVVGVLNPAFNVAPNNRLGDGVNVNDAPYAGAFPFLAPSPSGRDRRHIDPGEPGCTGGVGAACLP
ncbi:MAG: DUF4331 domain-containing protein [Acidobacteria bacterium]|nr:DUF4331 domain-containing protein [Acidobacteriota bacterium]